MTGSESRDAWEGLSGRLGQCPELSDVHRLGGRGPRLRKSESRKGPCPPLPLFPRKRFPSLPQPWLRTQIQAHNFRGPVRNEERGSPCSKMRKNSKRLMA